MRMRMRIARFTLNAQPAIIITAPTQVEIVGTKPLTAIGLIVLNAFAWGLLAK